MHFREVRFESIRAVFQAASENRGGVQLSVVLNDTGIDVMEVESFCKGNPEESVRAFQEWLNDQSGEPMSCFRMFHEMADSVPNLTELTFRNYCEGLTPEDRDELVNDVFMGEDYLPPNEPTFNVFTSVDIGQDVFLKIARAAFKLTSPYWLINRFYPLVNVRCRKIEESRLVLISNAPSFCDTEHGPPFWGFVYGLLVDGFVSQVQLTQVEDDIHKRSWTLNLAAKGWMPAIWAAETRSAVFASMYSLLIQNDGKQEYTVAFYDTMVNALQCFMMQIEVASSILEWLLSKFHTVLAGPSRWSLACTMDYILKNRDTLHPSALTLVMMDSILVRLVQDQIEDLQFWFPVDSYLTGRIAMDREAGLLLLQSVVQASDLYRSSFLWGMEPFRSLDVLRQPEFSSHIQALVESKSIEDILHLLTLFNRVFVEVPRLSSKITSERSFLTLIMAYRWRGYTMEANAARLFVEFIVVNSSLERQSLRNQLVHEIFRTAVSYKSICFDRWMSMKWEIEEMRIALARAKDYFETRSAIAESEALGFGFPGMTELETIHEYKYRSRVYDFGGKLNSILNIFTHADVIYGGSLGKAAMQPIIMEFEDNYFLYAKPERSDIISKSAVQHWGTKP